MYLKMCFKLKFEEKSWTVTECANERDDWIPRTTIISFNTMYKTNSQATIYSHVPSAERPMSV